MVMQPTKRFVQQTRQLLRGTLNGLVQSCSLVSDSQRLSTFKTGLQHATMILRTAFAAIFVAQMNLYASHTLAEICQSLLKRRSHVRSQSLGALNVNVGVDLNFHGFPNAMSVR